MTILEKHLFVLNLRVIYRMHEVGIPVTEMIYSEMQNLSEVSRSALQYYNLWNEGSL